MSVTTTFEAKNRAQNVIFFEGIITEEDIAKFIDYVNIATYRHSEELIVALGYCLEFPESYSNTQKILKQLNSKFKKIIIFYYGGEIIQSSGTTENIEIISATQESLSPEEQVRLDLIRFKVFYTQAQNFKDYPNSDLFNYKFCDILKIARFECMHPEGLEFLKLKKLDCFDHYVYEILYYFNTASIETIKKDFNSYDFNSLKNMFNCLNIYLPEYPF